MLPLHHRAKSEIVSVGRAHVAIEKRKSSFRIFHQSNAHREHRTEVFRIPSQPISDLTEREIGSGFDLQRRQRKGPSCTPRNTSMNSQPVAAEQGSLPIVLKSTLNPDLLAQLTMSCVS